MSPFTWHALGPTPINPAELPLAWRTRGLTMVQAALGCETLAEVREQLLSELVEQTGAEWAAAVQLDAARWNTLTAIGRPRALPHELLAETLDRTAVGKQVREGWTWIALPLVEQNQTCEVWLLAGPAAGFSYAREKDALLQLALLTPLLAAAVQPVRKRATEQRRIERLEAILQIAGQWNQAREMEPLLILMAEAATRLLHADRASIFLWDRAAKQLVGRPALGVPGGELRIPDAAGVVGHVVQTGETCRVDAAQDPTAINRQVDQKFGYQTQTLLCVPLNGRDGQRFGAFEVINKKAGTFTSEDEAALVELAGHAAIALENTQERATLLETRQTITDQAAQSIQMIGNSPAIVALRDTLARVAQAELHVLVLGENGTGKEVASQSIHYFSHRRNQPFVAINCAALPDTLLESELFGHERGAFTDAHDTRAGKFELAAGGTLFLDEIGDMSLAGQAKLLRVLEEKTVVRVGGSKPIRTDARVVAATNQNLADLVRQKRFRQDLYYRLAVVTIELPPLRERAEDVLLLAEHFLDDFSRKARRKRPLKLSAEASRRLVAHRWPGNVRELRNLMERLAYLSPGDRVEADELAFILAPQKDSATSWAVDLPLADATDRFQSTYITQAIERMGGNMTEAARLLGLHRSNLYRKLRQLELEAPAEDDSK